LFKPHLKLFCLIKTKYVKPKLDSCLLSWKSTIRSINGTNSIFVYFKRATLVTIFGTPGFNFINVLLTAFMLADPESIKRY
jgi:hypothetical protein